MEERLDHKNITVFDSPADLAAAACALFVETAEAAFRDRGRFTVALSGGSTPKALYSLLAAERFDDLFRRDIVIFFGDERFVPPDDAESNFRMVNESLLQPRSVEPEKVYRWRTELATPEIAANDYQDRLVDVFGRDMPAFDLVLLGIGADGHTASLFPGTAAISETERYAVANEVPQLNATRLTLTLPVLNNARRVVFLAAGKDKAAAVARAVVGVPSTDIPASLVRLNDPAEWLVDMGAAQDII